MMRYPSSLTKLIENFQMYPGIGPKTAERLALFTIQKLSSDKVKSFSDSLKEVLEKIKKCEICGNITEGALCDICSSPTRDDILMVVESVKDVLVFEKTNQYNGRYHVLGDLISPLNGVSPEDINLKTLISRVEKEKIREIIIATSANIEGEMTALYIKNIFEGKDVSITRIGYGLPVGGDIEYADEVTLIKSLEGRKKL
ncbi:MAG TPA: recombination mediator RecR [Bacilli bacterium]|nr:recombination protein RecR [Acholeplasmataceae bacterium]HNZ78008.1 recombination mediator RecR [Bacilli bacterium]HOD61012.1 recombination mediator RecR [Bacilli bacterium]HOH60870.1 recombination mediator RecR [Bacilli bacterium]HPB48792.1 recombination mediator RecR [Bacilli bacterium]